jgi:hypothetical protein
MLLKNEYWEEGAKITANNLWHFSVTTTSKDSIFAPHFPSSPSLFMDERVFSFS